MSEMERQKLRSKGIFTVTQLSYTFRPRRRPKRLRDKREKYHHSLKALAVREKKIHIVGRPALKDESTPVYLDVEGLPDRDFYYLIGVRMATGLTPSNIACGRIPPGTRRKSGGSFSRSSKPSRNRS